MNPFQERNLTPWDGCAHGVVSLFDMLQFYGDFFADKMAHFNAYEAKLLFEKRENPAKTSFVLILYAEIGVFGELCRLHGLQSSAAQCGRIMENLQDKHMVIDCGRLRDDLRELRRRCEDEFKTAFFLHLTPKESDQYQNPLKGWEEVANRFYRVRFNIEESSKCLALERYGAAVFHALQVAEYGVIELAKLLRVEGDRPGWGALKRLSAILERPYPQRSDLEKKHSKLLDSTVHLAVIVKDNWRHKLDHVDNQIIWVENDFSENVAREIISAIQAFMRQLAKMPHEPKPKFSIRNAL